MRRRRAAIGGVGVDIANGQYGGCESVVLVFMCVRCLTCVDVTHCYTSKPFLLSQPGRLRVFANITTIAEEAGLRIYVFVWGGF